MRHLVCTTITTLALAACGGGPSSTQAPTVAATSGEASSGSESASEGASEAGEVAEAVTTGDAKKAEFVLRKSGAPKDDEEQGPAPASNIKATKTEAAMKFIVVDKEKGPIPGIVISLTAPDGKVYYTEETSAEGYAEVLVPVGQKYELVYLSLGRRDIAATVPVSDEPNQNVKLTLRYKRYISPRKPATPAAAAPEVPAFVLEGVTFDSGKATIRPESFPRLDSVVEYMTYKKSARIEISGHTDNVGNPKTNKALSEKRAQACRDYLISKGVDGGRIQAVGYGDERPIASNDTAEGQQQNRRIEAIEL
jgi:OOP family OmpA-OmpF porin